MSDGILKTVSNNSVPPKGHDVTVELAREDVKERKNCKDYKEVVKNYAETSYRYEQSMTILGWPGPRKVAVTVESLLPGQFDTKILDVGAGTGMVGVELTKRGYTMLDAVDASDAMLKSATEKNIYQNITCHDVGDTPMPFEDNSYDMVVVCGAFSMNFMPVQALDDIIRVVKPGGYVVNTAGIFQEEWFANTFEARMKRFEELGLWRQLSRAKFPGFLDMYEGCIFVHTVL